MATPYLLPQLVDRAAEAHPQHIAYRCRREGLTYAALATSANKLANVLRDFGVAPGDRVGVLLSKDIKVPVAIYGTLKAGGVFVPIDPQAPSGRIRFVLEDCGIKVVIADERHGGSLQNAVADGSPLRATVGLATTAPATLPTVSWRDVDGAPAQALSIAATEQDLAYIMYTSGSTGQPKGLMHTHASGLAYARLSADVYGVSPDDCIGGHAPLHTDMSTFAYLTSPLRAATTVIVPAEHTVFPIELSRLMQSERISIWYSVPGALLQLIDRGALDQHDHSCLRWVLFGGEPMGVRQLEALMGYWPQARFANVYGPAEVNQCTHHEVTRGDLSESNTVPLGRVCANVRAMIVDQQDREVADGASGDFVVQTPTMMHGYWNRPDLNQEAFLRRERFPGFTERYYRTGDLVRRRSDGLLEFVGRKDRQLKIRGFRVELDEVEASLVSHPAVREAAVLAEGDTATNRQLVAAVLLRRGATATTREILNYVRERLPPYATPTVVLSVEDFPRTGAGKIDRRALRALFED